ncbi:MAG: radical SAM family heme chaperone HemW [Pseudomonadales bacterium]|nr:radical SAM family heme chaperone HemW [Pseudomonadales bacterium]
MKPLHSSTAVSQALPPLSLYVHIPWCEKKCPYCDFNSHTSATALPEQAYVDCLRQDLRAQQAFAQGRRLRSIFFGGGTPSLFSAAAIGQILVAAEQLIGFEANCEITLEANPGSAELKKFADFRQAGVNRLSIGVQSFADQQLQALGRVHDRQSALAAISAAQRAGFQRFNIDLMHGLPEQSEAAAMQDLALAIDLGAQHISWYQLTIEQNTAFYRYPPRLPDEDVLADIQQQGVDLLAQHQLYSYEVSAYASDHAQQSVHNLNYWHYGDYLAIGAGAHGKYTQFDHNAAATISRFHNTRLPNDYLARTERFVAKQQTIMPDEALFEALMNGLRLTEGIPLTSLLNFTGASEEQLRAMIEPLCQQQLLQCDHAVRATARGRQYLNFVLEALLDC